jgi:hypothetical protein
MFYQVAWLMFYQVAWQCRSACRQRVRHMSLQTCACLLWVSAVQELNVSAALCCAVPCCAGLCCAVLCCRFTMSCCLRWRRAALTQQQRWCVQSWRTQQQCGACGCHCLSRSLWGQTGGTCGSMLRVPRVLLPPGHARQSVDRFRSSLMSACDTRGHSGRTHHPSTAESDEHNVSKVLMQQQRGGEACGFVLS